MDFKKIYGLGKVFPGFHIKSVDEKLKFILFPYNSKHLIGSSLAILLLFTVLTVMFMKFSSFFVYAFMFLGVIIAIALFIYPTSIYYTQQLIDYREEMLKAAMKISTYISMHTSLEYAFQETTKDLRGTLKLQFEDIHEKIRIKERVTLGAAIADYIDVWNKINPEFVKALKLLQTATMSPKEEKDEIINEVIETIILSYHNSGKRFAESLASKAKTLVAVGVLLPIISLMILPLVSVFLPHLVKPALIAFIYNIFFPTCLLLMALHFSASRVQVSTIKLEDSPAYTKVPYWLYAMALAIIGVFAYPTIMHLRSINMVVKETAQREYALGSVLVVSTIVLGVVIAVFFFSYYYIKKYQKMWQEVYETEQDFPHLLQIFSTYLGLNRSVESVIPEIIDDYEVHGYKEHPIVNIFKTLKQKLYTTKQTIKQLCWKVLPKICPSTKVSSTIAQIIGFTDIDQKSAGKAAKMIRKQSLSIYKLDDYIKSMLSETVALINITTTMLAPLLSAAAVIMSLAIVMSLTFIQDQLQSMSVAMGGAASKLSLVDITQIIPPTVIEVVVGIYLLQMVLILSLFASNIKIGNDRYQLAKTINSNIVLSFMIYSIILVVGFVVFKATIFQGVMT